MSNHLSSEAAHPSCVDSATPQESSAGQALLCIHTENRPRSRPGTSWSDNISDLAWSRLGVKPAEISDISVGRAVFRVLPGPLSPRRSPEEKRARNEFRALANKFQASFVWIPLAGVTKQQRKPQSSSWGERCEILDNISESQKDAEDLMWVSPVSNSLVSFYEFSAYLV